MRKLSPNVICATATVMLAVLEEEVEVVEARRIVATGIVRCRIGGARGWVSEKTADGQVILEVLPTE